MEPIFEEIEKGNLDVVKQWLKGGQDADYVDKRKRTLLMHAAMGGHASIVKMLLEKGASMSVADQYGYIPPYFAGGDLETVRLFIDRGVSVTSDISGCKEKETFLLHASFSNSPELITYLLDLGSDVNAISMHGNTPLMRAAYAGHTECCHILLDAGADIMARTDSDNALSNAARQGHEETALLLIDRGAECIVEAFFGAIDRNLVSVMDRMLKTVPDLAMARGHLETTPLIVAVETGSIPMIKRLLKAGVNIDDQDDEGWSALMHATYRDDKEIIAFLREAGANEKLKDSKGMAAADLSDDFYDYDAD